MKRNNQHRVSEGELPRTSWPQKNAYMAVRQGEKSRWGSHHRVALKTAAENGWGLKKEIVSITEYIRNQETAPATPTDWEEIPIKRKREPSPTIDLEGMETFLKIKKNREEALKRRRKIEQDREKLEKENYLRVKILMM